MTFRRFLFFTLAVLALALGLSGCGLRKSQLVLEPMYGENPEVLPALWEVVPSGRQWSLHSYNQIRKLQPSLTDLNIRDMDQFCPEYQSFDRTKKLNFWLQLVANMTKFESSFSPTETHPENFKDQYGNQVISRGLLQMSIGSVEKICGFKEAESLHNPFLNLSCGIRLLHRYIARDGVITDKIEDDHRGGARYWAVLRQGHESLKGIQNLTRSFCRR